MVALARVLPVLVCVLSLFAARPLTPLAPVVVSAVHRVVRDPPTGPPNAIQWLAVSPRDPRTLYVGRYSCPMVFLRSRDAGRTWRSLLDAAQLCVSGDQGPGAGGNTLTGPLLIAGDGLTLFLDEEYNEGSADYLAYLLLSSADGGDRWSIPEHGEDYGSGTHYAALGPPSPRLHGPQFLYTMSEYHPPFTPGSWVSYGDINASSNGTTAGGHIDLGNLAGAPGSCCFNAPVPDLRDPTIVYVNLQNNDVPDFAPGGVLRSEHGRAWVVVARPRARPPLCTFSVATDPHEAGLLVGRTQDTSVPPDRVYLSADHGRTWRAAACPGVLRGSCPAAAIDNAFGAGASYAFVGDGLYRFHGAGPATDRLPLSARLPVPSRAIAAVTGGPRPGDPVYLTLKGPAGAGAPVFYRTLDAGRTWQRIAVPNPPLH